MDFRILGPLEVRRDGVVVAIPTRRQRALLVLLLEANRVVSVDRLVDRLWEGRPPPQAAVTLRAYVSNLRRALSAPAGTSGVLATPGHGYVVEVTPEDVDVVGFERLAERARAQLAGGDADAAVGTFDTALALWRGGPLADVADLEAARGEVVRLEELHLAVQEDRFEALLAAGRHADAPPALEAFVAEHPLRERPRAQLMVALYRCGRAPGRWRYTGTSVRSSPRRPGWTPARRWMPW